MKERRAYRLIITLLAVFTAFSTYACSNKCEYDRDCPLDRVCLAGTCAMSCAYNSSICSGGEVCAGGVCVHTCTSDSDCNGTMYCAQTGICTAPITTDNTVHHEPTNLPEDEGSNNAEVPEDNKPNNGNDDDAESDNNGDAATDNS